MTTATHSFSNVPIPNHPNQVSIVYREGQLLNYKYVFPRVSMCPVFTTIKGGAAVGKEEVEEEEEEEKRGF